MATKIYFHAGLADYHTGNNDARLNGSAAAWTSRPMNTSVGTGLATTTFTPVAGPTNGVEVGTATVGNVWYSPPLAAAATISGSITWNLWAFENNMSDNVAINGRLEVIDGATGVITLIDQTTNVTEVAVLTRAVNNFAETPAAGITCKKGDRLRCRVFADDAGTMAAGSQGSFSFDGPTGAADGDSWFQLTETLTFVSEPAGTQVFPTDTASDVITAAVDREAWTSRGGGVQTDVTNTVAGWTAPIQITDTAGGTVVDWFTRPLTAFTLGGAVRVNVRASASGTFTATPRTEVARVAGDGTSPSVWAVGMTVLSAGTSEAAFSSLISGDDLAISNGQRLRIRFYIDDPADLAAAMPAGRTVTLYYGGAAAATGDTYLTFSQTLTEYSAVAAVPVPRHPGVNFQDPGLL